jgi:hypothetical protein
MAAEDRLEMKNTNRTGLPPEQEERLLRIVREALEVRATDMSDLLLSDDDLMACLQVVIAERRGDHVESIKRLLREEVRAAHDSVAMEQVRAYRETIRAAVASAISEVEEETLQEALGRAVSAARRELAAAVGALADAAAREQAKDWATSVKDQVEARAREIAAGLVHETETAIGASSVTLQAMIEECVSRALNSGWTTMLRRELLRLGIIKKRIGGRYASY